MTGTAVPPSSGGLGRQAAVLAGATGVAQIGTAVIYLLAARASGPEAFGYAVTAVAIATSAVGFIDFGTNSLWLREAARGELSPTEMVERAFGKLLIAAAVFVIGGVLLFFLVPAPGIWTAAPIGLFLLLSQTAQVPLRASSRMMTIATSLMVDRAVGLAVLGMGMSAGADGAAVLWVALIAGSTASTALLVAKMPHRGTLSGTRTFSRTPWMGSGFYGLSNVAVTAQALDVAIMSAVAGPSAAGVYGAVNRWTQPMALAVTAFAASAVPVVARARSWSVAWPQLKKALWLPLAAMIACLVVFLAAPFFVHVLVGDAYADSADVLRVLAVGTLFAIVNQPLAVFQQSLGRDRPVSFVTMFSVVVQLGLVAVLAGLHGPVGAAWAFVVAQASICVLLLLVMTRSRSARRRDEGS
jgi:O-antigen/teichoic acid export membrane protein